MHPHKPPETGKTDSDPGFVTLRHGSRVRVYGEYAFDDGSSVVATGWRSAAVIKIARWRRRVKIAFVALAAVALDFTWWQFALLAGSANLLFNSVMALLVFKWLRDHLRTMPRPDDTDKRGLENWRFQDRYLAAHWLGRDGWLGIVPGGQKFLTDSRRIRLRTLTAWLTTHFTLASVLTGTLMWLLRFAIVWIAALP